MRTVLLALALVLGSGMSQAQRPPAAGLDLSPEQVDRMAESFGRAVVEGRVWARVKPTLDVLYRELRGQGETSKQALHNLRRIALPGVDIAEFGERGQQVRRDLEVLALYTRQRDGLSESAALAATALALHDVLQTLVAIERPSHIHVAVAGQDGIAQPRRAEPLYEGQKPRTIVAFTERLGAPLPQECTVDTLGLSEEVYFTVTCNARGQGTHPMASAKSECSINNDRLRALRLVLQPSDASPSAEVFVWCSFAPR